MIGRRLVPDPVGLALLVIGAVALTMCALPIDAHHVSRAEVDVFRAVNDPTLAPFVVVWPIMQLGNFLVVPVAAAIAAAFRKWWLALGLLVAGAVAYELAADVIRRLVERGRPPALLPDVHIRGAAAGGLGFVSGHVAVITALAVVAWPYLGRVGRVIAILAPVVVAVARMNVGAHFPLDVAGGAALGLAVGGAVRLALGYLPARRPAGQSDRVPATTRRA
ncbi:MAG TPA: phosphatase PAP2 family protein [Jatrophihabitantaceae bacterium]|jgi:undecaprenyl-diphosphatase